MSDFFNFAENHPFLTWFLAWGIWPICWMLQKVLVAPFAYSFRAWNRTLRSRNVVAHGWPKNPLMDADGDIVHPPKTEGGAA